MKKTAVLAILLAITPMLFASNLTIGASSKGVKVYNAYGKAVYGSTVVEDGWFITTESDAEVTLITSDGTIMVAGDSILSNGTEADGTPYVYLMDGVITVKRGANSGKLNIYTPVRLYKLDGTCSMTVISDDDHDSYGINAGSATLYDAIRGTTDTLEYKEIAEEPEPAKTEETSSTVEIPQVPEVATDAQPVVIAAAEDAKETEASVEKAVKEKKKIPFSFGIVAEAATDFSFSSIGPFTAMPCFQIGNFVIAPQLSFNISDFSDPDWAKNIFGVDTENGQLALYRSIMKFFGQVSYDGILYAGLTSRRDFEFSSPVMRDIDHEYDDAGIKSLSVSFSHEYVDAQLYVRDVMLGDSNAAELEVTGKYKGLSLGASMAVDVQSMGSAVDFADIATQATFDLYPAVNVGLKLFDKVELEAFATIRGFDFSDIANNFTAGASLGVSFGKAEVEASAVYGKNQFLYGFIGNQAGHYALSNTGVDMFEFGLGFKYSGDIFAVDIDIAAPLLFNGGVQLAVVAPGISPEVTSIKLEIEPMKDVLRIEAGYQATSVASVMNQLFVEAKNEIEAEAFDGDAILAILEKLIDPSYADYYVRADLTFGKFFDAYIKTDFTSVTVGAKIAVGKADESKVDF